MPRRSSVHRLVGNTSRRRGLRSSSGWPKRAIRERLRRITPNDEQVCLHAESTDLSCAKVCLSRMLPLGSSPPRVGLKIPSKEQVAAHAFLAGGLSSTVGRHLENRHHRNPPVSCPDRRSSSARREFLDPDRDHRGPGSEAER